MSLQRWAAILSAIILLVSAGVLTTTIDTGAESRALAGKTEVASEEECVVIPQFFRDLYTGAWIHGGERELCGHDLHWGITAGPSYSAHINVLNREIERLRGDLNPPPASKLVSKVRSSNYQR